MKLGALDLSKLKNETPNFPNPANNPIPTKGNTIKARLLQNNSI